MATANQPVNVRLEKLAIDYLDSFIDNRKNMYGPDYAVPLMTFQGYVATCNLRGVRQYIGEKKADLENFIIDRPYWWKVRAASLTTTTTTNRKNPTAKMLVVEKRSTDVREALIRVLAYVQRKSDETGLGAKLNNISVLIGQHHTTVKRALGIGLHGIASFLGQFPTLFEMIPYDPDTTDMGDILYKNRAIVVDGTIVVLDHGGGRERSDRLEGNGTVIKLFANYGFVLDARTKEVVYFDTRLLPAINAATWRRWMADGERFQFEAFVSHEFEAGKTGNKWSVTRMWPLRVVTSRNGGEETSASTSSLSSTTTTAAASSSSSTANQSTTDHHPRPSAILEEEHIQRSDALDDFSDLMAIIDNELDDDFDFDEQLDDGGADKMPPATGVVCTITSFNPSWYTAADVVPKSLSSGSDHRIRLTPKSEKRDASCQTEFNDEREILMRLLRRSPDLLKLVRAFRE